MATGIVSDQRFINHINPPYHPETRERLVRIYAMLEQEGWTDKLVPVAERAATIEEVSAIHSEAHYQAVKKACESGSGHFDPDTFYSEGSFEAACYAAGGLLQAIDEIIEGKIDNAFAAVRPPGHHAERDRAMGFCLFNNVAIAAAYLLNNHSMERVLIVDWDVHHGNGTQHSFESDSRVLFISAHQFPFYPGSGSAGETGRGEGAGYTINLPLRGGQGDGDYIHLFNEIIRPAADQFKPQFILLSAGYDAYKSDPLGGMSISESGYGRMAAILREIAEKHCSGRLAAVLEGGYSLDGIPRAIHETLRAFDGSNDFFESDPEPAEEVKLLAANTKKNNTILFND